MKISCFTCKYGYEDERLGIPMCHHPKRFSEDCVNFNMHEEKESENPSSPTVEEPIDGVLYAAACGIKNAAGKSEKPVPNNLEEAARRYAIPTYMKDVDENFLDEYPYDPVAEKAFIAGATWQKEQDDEESEMNPDYQEGECTFYQQREYYGG